MKSGLEKEFDAYIKKTIIHTTINFAKAEIRKRQKEVSYELLENNLISAEDKEKVAKIVDSLDKGTDKQKLRFKTLYHLLPNLPVCYTLDAYAKLEGCTVNAIKGSIARVRNRLINRSTEDDINCIKEINKRVEEQK